MRETSAIDANLVQAANSGITDTGLPFATPFHNVGFKKNSLYVNIVFY